MGSSKQMRKFRSYHRTGTGEAGGEGSPVRRKGDPELTAPIYPREVRKIIAKTKTVRQIQKLSALIEREHDSGAVGGMLKNAAVFVSTGEQKVAKNKKLHHRGKVSVLIW